MTRLCPVLLLILSFIILCCPLHEVYSHVPLFGIGIHLSENYTSLAITRDLLDVEPGFLPRDGFAITTETRVWDVEHSTLDEQGRFKPPLETPVEGDSIYTSPEHLEFIFTKMRDLLQQEHDSFKSVQNIPAVIAVPEYFSDDQLTMIKEAALEASIRVQLFGRESTIAVYEYNHEWFKSKHESRSGEMIWLVMNLDGAAASVAIMNEDANCMRSDCSGADSFFEYLSRIRETGISTDVLLMNSAFPLHSNQDDSQSSEHVAHDVGSNREEQHQVNSEIFVRLLSLTDRAIRDANLEPAGIHDVIVISHSPILIPLIRGIFSHLSHEPHNTHPVTELIVRGAAIKSLQLQLQRDEIVCPGMVVPHSLSVETNCSMLSTVIPRNSLYPTRKSIILKAADSQQNEAFLRIFEGEGNESRCIGELTIALSSASQVLELTLDVNKDGILSVIARDVVSGSEQKIQLHSASAFQCVGGVEDAPITHCRTPQTQERCVSIASQEPS